MLGTQLLTCALGAVQGSCALPAVFRDQLALHGTQDAQILLPRVSKLIPDNILRKKIRILKFSTLGF